MLNKFHYKNFEADFDARVLAERALERLEEAAPYSATILGILEKSHDGYWAYLDVYSKQGTFLATAHGASLAQALVTVEEKMKAKLNRWKKERSAEVYAPVFLPRKEKRSEAAKAVS
jgi:hypothetical protein